MEDGLFAQIEAKRGWEHARQAAVIEEVLAVLSRRQIGLLSFDEVREKLRLTQKNYRGVQDIEVSRIRGSVGRYQDFTQSFLPRNSGLRERWQRVSAISSIRGMVPIDVYQVGEAYFVLDGNHRVSIARQNSMPTIQAHVWEFETPVGLSSAADLDELIIRAEYTDFLRNTRLDELRPEQQLIFTAPGRYRELEYQIAMYQRVLEQIDEEPISFEDAVTAWYDMVYTPAVQIIHERGILEHFPGRTEADLFIWVWRYHRELSARGIASLAHAVDEVGKHARWPLPGRLWQAILNFLRASRGD